MPKRHHIHPGDWESLFRRLEELVLANSGEDEFEEIFKILVGKLYSELEASGTGRFRTFPSATATAAEFNTLLGDAAARWPGILPTPPASRLSDDHLAICVEAIESVSLSDTALEVLDGAFEYLMSRSSKGVKGQFFTPRHVVDCCVKIVNPKLGETVLDPECGPGGFLIHAINHVRVGQSEIASFGTDRVWGCDFDGRAVRVAKALMLIAGDGHRNLYRVNSLLTNSENLTLFPRLEDETPRLTIEDLARARFRRFDGFDVILTNPPFAGEVREKELLDTYELSRPGRRMERDILFLERCVQLLRPNGRLAIVLPHNKFAGDATSYLRSWLTRRMHVVAVLGLGRHTFMPHTAQKASVLFAKKRSRPVAQPPPDERTLFLISERDWKDSRGQIVPRSGTGPEDPAWVRADHDLAQAVEGFREFVRDNDVKWDEDVA